VPAPKPKPDKPAEKPKDKNKAKVDNAGKQVESKANQVATLKKLGEQQA